MAIVIEKDLDITRLLNAYNNNIVKFRSDNVGQIVKSATIIGLGINTLLRPHPDGLFVFNFKDDIKTSINTKNFIDDFIYVLDPLNPATYHYDVTNGFYLDGNVEYKINYDDGSYDILNSNVYRFLASVENLESFKNDKIIIDESTDNMDILSPVENRFNAITGDNIYLKYWIGYPFEFSFYIRKPNVGLAGYNLTSTTNFEINPTGQITSLFISDGVNEFSAAGLQPGLNQFEFEANGNTIYTKLNLESIEEECGVYVKFINKYGRYNYWLFSKNYFKNRTSKYLPELENDFNNLEDTVSPTLQIGKSSDSTIKCAAKNLNEKEKLILEGIIDSPKILLFTGTPGTVSTNKDWMEVKLKTTTFPVQSPNRKLFSFYLELDLPARNTITL